MENCQCPVCGSEAKRIKEKGEYFYYKCGSCRVIFISPEVMCQVDEGKGIITYNNSYWNEELRAARTRSWGTSLARVAEVFLYARLPIRKFVDIGSGPGYLLDALSYQLPSSTGIFYAQELFPPAPEFCTDNKNYNKGNLTDFSTSFDAGCCIEVIEHLTPSMVKGLFNDLAKSSRENSIYIFNTGLVEYIENEDMDYLDPYTRGHITGWSIESLQYLAGPMGFQVMPITGKSWAFIAEYKPNHSFNLPIEERIWQALTENVDTLRDKSTGDLMYILGMETVRAYL